MMTKPLIPTGIGLLSSMKENGVETIVNVSASKKSLDRVNELMKNYSFIYGAFGLHPDEVGDMTDELLEKIRLFSRQEKAVAIGEIGLDYYWIKNTTLCRKNGLKPRHSLPGKKNCLSSSTAGKPPADTLDMVKGFAAEKSAASSIVFPTRRKWPGNI